MVLSVVVYFKLLMLLIQCVPFFMPEQLGGGLFRRGRDNAINKSLLHDASCCEHSFASVCPQACNPYPPYARRSSASSAATRDAQRPPARGGRRCRRGCSVQPTTFALPPPAKPLTEMAGFLDTRFVCLRPPPPSPSKWAGLLDKSAQETNFNQVALAPLEFRLLGLRRTRDVVNRSDWSLGAPPPPRYRASPPPHLPRPIMAL